ncbi:hypothetical protein GPECTOR_420g277 [Gonium pectorale]|uniref:FAD-dependent oxidoreductase domain-containing protein 1 n=1 Tax=Gonium pectorale TaxID=33097 RepID=A0A150FV88_GONPE|nr:hypothetical protein GPECTOR_420g277 [Gonium pectorale]|eukprot:KXZ41516.1 hypothetical protein GPECTOR_420g277 [Gonium pectorale]
MVRTPGQGGAVVRSPSGQGYLWMAHRTPGSVGWALAARSMALWRRMADSEELRRSVEWQDCGSLLIATSPAESAALSERQLNLNDMGVRASFADARRLRELEPGLVVPRGGAGLLVQSDHQINGRATAHMLLELCRGAAGFTERMGTAGEVLGVELAAAPGGGHVVRTSEGRVTARRALVLSAGVWTGGLLATATRDPRWGSLLQPRRGHLLEMPAPSGMPPVSHGMMEMSYTKAGGAPHYATATTPHSSRAGPSAEREAEAVDITFTATTSASGSLLIGSSREFSGYDSAASPAIVAAILQRAALFLPGLKLAAEAAAQPGTQSGSPALAGLSVRVGLRPYAVGGLPMVGPVDGAPGVFVAAGHEGSGLCMGPATGELLSRHVRRHLGEAPASGCLDTASFDELLPSARLRAALVAA